MNSLLKTKEQKLGEDTENSEHGIIFVKVPETECDDPNCKDRTSLRAEISSADKGIELEDAEQSLEMQFPPIKEGKEEDKREYPQKESKDGVTILPNHESSDFPEEDDIPKNLRFIYGPKN